MKKLSKVLLLVVLSAAILISVIACAPTYEETTFTSYEIVHQGYVGEAKVTINADGTVKTAVLNEYLVTDFITKDTAEVDSLDGLVYRVKDSLSNVGAPTGIAGYFFYQYNATKEQWLQYNYNITAKTWSAHASRNILTTFSGNRLRMKDYVEGITSAGLVTVSGETVTAGKSAMTMIAASSYKTFSKTDAGSGYMPLGASTIGYRYNALATVEFFKNNAKADISKSALTELKVTLTANTAVSSEDIAKYTATTDSVWKIDDATSSATWSDFPQYMQLLQQAYNCALALQRG